MKWMSLFPLSFCAFTRISVLSESCFEGAKGRRMKKSQTKEIRGVEDNGRNTDRQDKPAGNTRITGVIKNHDHHHLGQPKPPVLRPLCVFCPCWSNLRPKQQNFVPCGVISSAPPREREGPWFEAQHGLDIWLCLLSSTIF